jgi:hypothetical protein
VTGGTGIAAPGRSDEIRLRCLKRWLWDANVQIDSIRRTAIRGRSRSGGGTHRRCWLSVAVQLCSVGDGTVDFDRTRTSRSAATSQNVWEKELTAPRFEAFGGAFLIHTHQPRIACHVGGEGLRRDGGTGSCFPPASLAQTFEHLSVVFRPHSRHALANTDLERGRDQKSRKR